MALFSSCLNTIVGAAFEPWGVASPPPPPTCRLKSAPPATAGDALRAINTTAPHTLHTRPIFKVEKIMAPKSLHILLAFRSLLAVSAASRGPRLGGWKQISNPNAPEIVEIAKFAVPQHNKEKNTSLVFVSVVKGESQVVAGTNYRLVISAKDGAAAAPKTYTAIVWSKVAPKSLQLTSFEQIKG